MRVYSTIVRTMVRGMRSQRCLPGFLPTRLPNAVGRTCLHTKPPKLSAKTSAQDTEKAGL